MAENPLTEFVETSGFTTEKTKRMASLKALNQHQVPGSGLKPLHLFDLATRDSSVRISPYCFRIKLAMIYKGLPYTTEAWNFTQKDRLPKDLLGQKPTGRVPNLVDPNNSSGKRQQSFLMSSDANHGVQDSLRIAKYLDEKYPKFPLITGPVEANYSIFLHQSLDRTVITTLAPLIIGSIYSQISPADQPYFAETRSKAYGTNFMEAQEKNRQKGPVAFQRSLASVREVLKTSPFLSGSRPGWFDFQLIGVFLWGRAVDEGYMKTVLAVDDPVKLWMDKMDSWIMENTQKSKL